VEWTVSITYGTISFWLGKKADEYVAAHSTWIILRYNLEKDIAEE
jgi:hypothetical protein